MAEEDDAFIRVKTLDGQSILVALSGDKKISDLRALLLARKWPMLQDSSRAAQSFHLVHKGVTLDQDTQLRSLLLRDGEFISCVPFARKKVRSVESQAPSATPSPAPSVVGSSEGDQNTVKRRRVDTTNSGSLSSEFPVAVQRLERVFCALNSVCGFLERNRIELTWKCVKSALQHSCTYIDEAVTVDDIRDLALICPKVVMMSKMAGDGDNVTFEVELQPKFSLGKRNISDAAVLHLNERRKMAFEHAMHEMISYVKSKNYADSEITLDLVRMSSREFFHRHAHLKTGPVVYARPQRRRAGSESTTRRQPFCKDASTLTATEVLEHLTLHMGSSGQIIHCEKLERRTACFGEVEGDLSEATKAALNHIGVTKLYSHQAAAVRAALLRKSIVVSTSTASGKSLCYNVPVLEEFIRNGDSCALYLFPTKALAQDQLRGIRDFAGQLCARIQPGVYDGDTPMAERQLLRDRANILLSNPDMLHCSILPFHKQFARFLSNLSYVVLDEAHAYKGAFGCHTSLIIRRLRRICTHIYGAVPTFIVCSATVANPQEHAMELTGLKEMTSIREDGSPCGEKFFVLWNPPLRCCKSASKDSEDGGDTSKRDDQVKRMSPILEIAALFAEMVQHGLRCITFCKSRKLCELVLSHTSNILKDTAPELQDSIRAYRAGYTPEERRKIEADLFGGKLRGVAATSALELGIDVGSLDATLHLGFPGTVSSLWQQAGRAGRREKSSLSIYVAFEGPLDQHFMKNPAKLFSKSIENAQVDSHNPQVLEQHLACAAFEHPLHSVYDEEYFSASLNPAISSLVKRGHLGRYPSCTITNSWNYIGEAKPPSSCFSIRAIDPEKYSIINEVTGKVIEEVEENKAFFQVYEGAVYINQGMKFMVKKLDLTTKTAFCFPTDVRYYTKTRDFTDVHIVGSELIYPRKMLDVNYRITSAQTNRCEVTTTWIGFRKIWEGSNETFDSVDLHLPKVSYESQATWIRVPNSVKVQAEAKGMDLRAGLHAASHALLNVLPLYITCNPSDVGTECAHPQDKRYYPVRLLVFDRCPGGIGISAQAQLLFAELLQAALEQVTACDCTVTSGCPNCVQYFSCDEYNEVLDKSAAVFLLEGVIRAEDEQREEAASRHNRP